MIAERVAGYASKKVLELIQSKGERFRVADLDFFTMVQKFSYANTPISQAYFCRPLHWIQLIQCVMNYPKANMMHIEVVKVIRNGVRYAVESLQQPAESEVTSLVAFLESVFTQDRYMSCMTTRKTTKMYFGYLL
jgi:hypothetical protein